MKYHTACKYMEIKHSTNWRVVVQGYGRSSINTLFSFSSKIFVFKKTLMLTKAAFI